MSCGWTGAGAENPAAHREAFPGFLRPDAGCAARGPAEVDASLNRMLGEHRMTAAQAMLFALIAKSVACRRSWDLPWGAEPGASDQRARPGKQGISAADAPPGQARGPARMNADAPCGFRDPSQPRMTGQVLRRISPLGPSACICGWIIRPRPGFGPPVVATRAMLFPATLHKRRTIVTPDAGACFACCCYDPC